MGNEEINGLKQVHHGHYQKSLIKGFLKTFK